MIIFLNFVVFMLVPGRAVCDELYPISVVEDIAQNQPEWSSNNYIEPIQGQPNDETFPASKLRLNDLDQTDLNWIRDNIVNHYKFVKEDKKDAWKEQPSFKEDLGTDWFIGAANKAKEFFHRNNDWSKTKRSFRTQHDCINLLYITAARYLLVTHILYEVASENGYTFIPCRITSVTNKTVIPDSGVVCFPKPYGTASCTSDYDVGLIGKDAGFLTEKFNLYFQSDNGFGKPSELVFDTNVYAFTLEFALPFMFVKLPVKFAENIAKQEQTINFKMQELASAYFKVFKYNKDFFEKMKGDAMNKMTAAVSKSKLKFWLKAFSDLDEDVPMRSGDLPLKDHRKAHNDKYQTLVKEMSAKGGYNPNFLGSLAKALIYAAEAYHTRGAIRHVVGGTQMEIVDTATELTTNDLWVSIIENWGETNKEYSHCQNDNIPLEECFLKMSKYMWRMFNGMRLVRGRLPPNARAGLVYFGKTFANPEFVMKLWLEYKKIGKMAIPKHRSNILQFLRQFHCSNEVLGTPLSAACIKEMNNKVNAYNVKLAGIVTDVPVKPIWRP